MQLLINDLTGKHLIPTRTASNKKPVWHREITSRLGPIIADSIRIERARPVTNRCSVFINPRRAASRPIR
jgi:hypothetical protein